MTQYTEPMLMFHDFNDLLTGFTCSHMIKSEWIRLAQLEANSLTIRRISSENLGMSEDMTSSRIKCTLVCAVIDCWPSMALVLIDSKLYLAAALSILTLAKEENWNILLLVGLVRRRSVDMWHTEDKSNPRKLEHRKYLLQIRTCVQ